MDTPFSTETLSPHAGEAARLLRALANRRRIEALCLLAACEEMSVGGIARRVSLSHSATSQHLSLMREDGLVATRRAGTTIYYRLADRRIASILTLLGALHAEPPRAAAA